jgi:hypothetical protein
MESSLREPLESVLLVKMVLFPAWIFNWVNGKIQPLFLERWNWPSAALTFAQEPWMERFTASARVQILS